MGYNCYICDRVIGNATTVSKYMVHLYSRHGLCSTGIQKSSLQCQQGNCCKTFDTVNSLRMHLKRCHPPETLQQTERNFGYPDGDLQINEDMDFSSDDELNHSTEDISNEFAPLPVSFIKDHIIDFILQLRVKKINQTVIDYTLKSVDSILKAVVQVISSSIPDGFNGQLTDILQMLSEIEDLVENAEEIRSDYLQKKYLIEEKGMVQPVEIAIGHRTESTSDGESVMKYVNDSMQYVPIIETITKVMSDTNNFINYEDQHDKVEQVAFDEEFGRHTLREYSDGEIYIKEPFFKQHPEAIQLHMYFDEFESVNPLGSKTSVHKVGALYMTIHNIPQQYNSKLNHIFPVAYCFAEDVKKYGFTKILEPLLYDLKLLESGLDVKINGEVKFIVGALTMWSGDNLGIHQLFGFSQSFNSNLPSHFCYGSKDDFQHRFRESDFRLRSEEQHEIDVQDVENDPNTSKISGVYSRCCLSQLKYFSIPNNICPDPMHDILEGCLQYEIKRVLKHFVNLKLFSVQGLNARLQMFDFLVDCKNKPTQIKPEKLASKDKKLGLNASQSWCLGRYIFLLIGDLIPTDDKHLLLLQLLMEITDIILAPAITVEITVYLEEIIYRHHCLFKTLFPDDTIIPKQHFLVHYPSKLRQLGPPSQYWCMRYEAKHAPSKDLCHIIRCFKNICKSVAWKEQIRLAVDWITPKVKLTVDVGTGQVILPVSLKIPTGLLNEHSISPNEEVFMANYLNYNGVKYKPNMIVVLGMNNGEPQLGQVKNILIVENEARLIIQMLHTYQFNNHYHSYEVTFKDEYTIAVPCKLHDCHPLGLHSSFEDNCEKTYIVMKYALLDSCY